ncbi:MAG TPA: ThiF family adenylyltransferase [bacterium]|nr:ThiF family adenylyltransferase [bacterium]
MASSVDYHQNLDRYQRQTVFAPIGPEGQARLSRGRVAIIGIGALGTMIANSLARAGVGFIRLIDSDRVETSNLQRQMLFEETDATRHRYKAEAASRHLRGINSSIVIEPIIARADEANIGELIDGVDVVLDGADNFDIRYIANDACRQRGLPWIYGGVLGDSGVTLNVLPDGGPCFRCLLPEPPVPGSYSTPALAGVLNQITAVIGSIEALEAVKLLVGSPDVRRTLLSIDLWSSSFRQIEVSRNPDCPICGGQRTASSQAVAG